LATDALYGLIPGPHPETAVEKVGGRWMVATPDDRLHYFVSEGGEEPSDVGDRILELADGTRTVREIAEMVCAEYEVEPETALKDTLELVSELLRNGVLSPMAKGGERPAGGAPGATPQTAR
jgi:hypothetical protein